MADRIRFAALELEVRHRHGEHWAPMEREHNPADAERDWAAGRIYSCRECDDSIQVRMPDTGRADGRRD